MSVFQTDLLLRSALIRGIEEIRKQPWTLDDIFSQLAQEPFLKKEFGYKNIRKIRDWFRRTEIPVIMQHRLDKGINLPCISVALLESQEIQRRALLGDGDTPDVFMETVFDRNEVDENPIIILGPFTPIAYDPITGLITLPKGFTTEDIFINQVLLDTRNNAGYPITECVSETMFKIAPGITNADFEKAIIIPQFQALGVTRQRSYFDETYQLAVHTTGEAEEILWLHAILIYVLLRFKKEFFEGAGLELTTFSSSDFVRQDAWGMQNVYSRYVTVKAIVEHSWVRSISRKVEGLRVDSIRIMDAGQTPAAFEEEVKKQGWILEDDDFND